MTYKLNPIVEKIASPVVLKLPDGGRVEYESGIDATNDSFEKKYVIENIRAANNSVEIEMIEQAASESTSWIGEEQTFF